jgi:hypothetical protein
MARRELKREMLELSTCHEGFAEGLGRTDQMVSRHLPQEKVGREGGYKDG